MKYAGIGSRATPPKILAEMGRIARTLSDHRWTLRTGGAAGADLAFEHAHIARREIFHPRQAPPDAIALTATALAAAHHPAWDRCSTYAKLLHARNSHIVLGARLDDPVDAVVCWTPVRFRHRRHRTGHPARQSATPFPSTTSAPSAPTRSSTTSWRSTTTRC